MKNYIQEELVHFIISFCEEMKIKNIDLNNINLNTSIDLDLNIFDDDIDLFVNLFAQQFQIDVSHFEWGKRLIYPTSDKMNFVYSIFRSFDYRKKWVKAICGRLYIPKVFIRDFQNAINIRILT
ncbi:hypothetical protein D3C71_52670 [compost metagenome]